ncbi:MAG: DUF2179 domain-containing protein [Candidatus Marinimicrobia bacterium]|nr:DUF2179 domain-containing protein [Candidatus Neomarinimicrobiota bacterium]
MDNFFDTNLFNWVILPILIFIARILDVSIGTIRIIFVSRGMKLWSTVLGFFEVLIWISVIGQVLQNLTNPLTYIAYAAGFATGNYVGIIIEQKISIGKVILRLITSKDITSLITFLKSKKLRYTVLDGTGTMGDVNVLFTIIERKKLPLLIHSVNKLNPTAFYSIEDVRQVKEGDFPKTFQKVNSSRPFSRIRLSSIMKRK